MKIVAERNMILPAGQPHTGMAVQPTGDGQVFVMIMTDGVQVTAFLSPEEAKIVGVSAIEAGHAARLTQEAAIKPAPSLIVNGVGRG